MSLGRALGALTGLLILASAATVAPADAKAPTPVTGTVTITGHGFGHGHGLSQWGAEGAARQGLDYRHIISFYFPHTSWGSAGGKVRVLITADTTRSVVVTARSGLQAHWVGHHRIWKLTHRVPAAKRWRIVPVSHGRSKLQYKVKAWHKLAVVNGDLEFNAGGAPITLSLPGGRSVAYRGILRAASPHAGGMDRDTVNIVSLDRYLQGVVPSEIPALWHPAAVQAQAVAARTYAAYERADQHGYYQICDTAACQVYGGYSAEHPASNAAVAATAGQIVTYGGKPAFTQFSASNGGATLAGGEPYLVSQTDKYDKAVSPYLNWSKTVTAADVEARWPVIGQLVDIQTTPSTANAPGAGYVSTVTIEGTKHSVTVTGDAFRSWAGLRSTWFSVAMPAAPKVSP
jgi:SpoIID/LytB domain protein